MLTSTLEHGDRANNKSTNGNSTTHPLLGIFYKEEKHKYSEFSDENLAKLYIDKKDEEALNEIAFRYIDKIYRLALSITRDNTDAEDVLQNVFLTLLEKIQYFRGESKFSTWIYRVSINATYSFLRVKKRNSSLSIESSGNDGSDHSIEYSDSGALPDKASMNKEILNIVHASINSLPEKYRIAIQLRDVEGLTNGESAEILNISITALKSRILRARKMLHKKLSTVLK